jgi:hypothetical protein
MAAVIAVGALVAGMLAAVWIAYRAGRKEQASAAVAEQAAAAGKAAEAQLDMLRQARDFAEAAGKLSDEQARAEAMKWAAR